MNKTIKRLLCCLLTIALTFLLIQRTGLILDPEWSQDGLDVIDAFDSLEDNSLDVIVYGSSHAWKGCDTRVMCDDYGIKAYNYACNWQAINTIKLFLEDSFRTQTPKVVCIEVGLVDSLEQNVDLDGQIYYTRSMSDFDGKRQYLKQCFGNDPERYISYYMPLYMFHDNWININYESWLFRGPERWINTKGYCADYSDTVREYELPDPTVFPQKELRADCINVLQDIVDLCHSKGVEVIFYTAPCICEYNYHDFMLQFALDNDCTYLDLYYYYDDLSLDGKTDFQDSDHLNGSGARKVAAFLAEYVIANYDVDHF